MSSAKSQLQEHDYVTSPSPQDVRARVLIEKLSEGL